MKKLLILLFAVCVTAFAEPSFDQVEGLIEKQQYAAAEAGLVEIIKNHPNSAKAYYAMAQAQAGLGNQEKARYALNKARGFDPELKFAPASSVQNLEQAITPQVKKIEPVHEKDYTWLKWILALGVLGLAIWYYNSEKAKTEEAAAKKAEKEREAAREELRAARAEATKAAPVYKAPEPPKWTDVQKPQAAPAPAPAPTTTYVAPQPTVVHHHHTTTVQGSNNDGLLTGMMLNEMMHNHHHDTTRVVEREVIREVPAAPAPKKDSSWDDDSSSSSSSSWFSSSPSKSSSWDDSSSSSSSSSWGSSSSSSSSSWDSGSSSSSSDSSWD